MLLVRVFALATAFMMLCPIPFQGTRAAPAMAGHAGSMYVTGPQPRAPPFGAGDWDLSGSEVMRDGGLILDGNLTIESGGSLTMVNSTLELLPGPHEIRVLSGGALNVLNGSAIGSFDSSEHDVDRAGFWVDDGASLDLEDSEFFSVGIIHEWYGPGQIGGICIFTSDSILKNCTFSGDYIALTMIGCSVTVDSCRFSRNNFGAESDDSDTVFANCTFDDNFEGAIAFSGVTGFRGCVFTGNANGAVLDSTVCTLTDCNFTGNVRAGINCTMEMFANPLTQKSTLTVQDCEFTGNRVGIGGIFSYADSSGNVHPLFHDLTLVNSDFRNDTEAAMLWWRKDPDVPKEQSTGVWKVTARCGAENEYADFNGRIDVDAGGELVLRHTTLKLDTERPGWNGIEVKAGGALDIVDGSELAAIAPGSPFRLACRPGSDFELGNSYLRDCGWDINASGTAGPYFDGCRAVINNSRVDFCPFALDFHGVRNGIVEGSSVRGTVLALALNGSAVLLQNSTLASLGASETQLDGGSSLECVNSTIDPDRAVFNDAESRLNISWYLGVRAIWADGRPVPGANLTINDSTGAEVVNTTVDGQGRADDIVLRQANFALNGSASFTPYHVRCWNGPIRNESDLDMDQSRVVALVLTDSEPPTITVLSPASGSYINSSTVLMTGSARDNLALGTVELTVDGLRHILVYQSVAGDRPKVDWNLTIELPDGFHTLDVLAVDSSGTRTAEGLAFTVDTAVPTVLVTSPPDGFLTNEPELAVKGMMEPGAEVFVNGVQAQTMGGTFTAVINLAEGRNTVTAAVFDRARNTNTSSISVTLDTTPPRLEVSFHPDAPSVNQPQVNLSGTMEFGSSITLNGRLVVVPGLSDNFTTLFFLVRGNNTIIVSATDAAGNVNTTEKRFFLDTIPPAFKIIYPPEGFRTNEPFLTLALVAEAGTDLTLGAATVRVPGPPGDMVNFTVNRTLAEGANTMVLWARDAAGNTFTVVRDVILDTHAPVLDIQSPPDGLHTANATVYIIGTTESGAAVSVNGEAVAVGYTGDFSIEVGLGPGQNKIVVVATDDLGNANETTINVTRVAARGEVELVAVPGADWPFIGFVLVAAAAVVSEGYWASRIIRRLPPRPGPVKGGG